MPFVLLKIIFNMRISFITRKSFQYITCIDITNVMEGIENGTLNYIAIRFCNQNLENHEISYSELIISI